MECLSFCLAESIKITQAEKAIKTQGGYSCTRYRELLSINLKHKDQYCFIFKNGTVVMWNIKRYQTDHVLPFLTDALINPLQTIQRDYYSYRYGNTTKIEPHDYFNVECITLEEDDRDLILALSYGLSASIKLNHFEHVIDNLITHSNPMLQKLANKTKLLVNRKSIMQILGIIIATKSDINLTSNFAYQPKFIWLHPNLEEYYIMIEKYLDISKRAKTLNYRIDTLNESFLLFESYLQNQHSHFLEIIIIVLIVIEIIFNVINLHFTIF